MTLADRIQQLRKQKGISQEELADRVGVSRQAVSKWESEQSTPDMDKVILLSDYFEVTTDKVILLSDYFEVTTDYLLKGIEPAPPAAGEKRADGRIFTIVATVLNLIGVLTACAVWYETLEMGSLIIGVVFLALGCMVFGIGMVECAPDSKLRAKRNFWTVDIWLLVFLPLSVIYNVLLDVGAAPYPQLVLFSGWPLWACLGVYALFWAVYIAICTAVTVRQAKAAKKQ